ncbi:MAG TPA: hypothetical protein ENK09_04220 [Nitrospirae bacterium]|nr:hypothetical protein [Nitrospirota bacterium]
MRKKTMPLVLLICSLLLLIAGCNMIKDANGKAVKHRSEKEEVRPDISGLTCFQCHSFEKYKKVFPHDNHRAMGLHCTQCHIIEGHKMARLNPETCKNCHNLDILEMNRSAMPVKFNHASHMSMFDCNNCHTKLFPMKVNAKAIPMDAINQGRFCGHCHNGTMAFASTDCQRCHEM